MANDWSGVDKPEYIPDTETDVGDYFNEFLKGYLDYIRIDMEQTEKVMKKAKEVLSNGRDSGD